MKKTLLFLWTILIIPIVLLLSVLCLPSQYESSYMGELKYKYNRLKNTHGKRIIIVGGSGMAFDIDSSLIEENFPDYDVVNMGMYAALGTASVLDMAAAYIHEGDIVIYAPEQNEQTMSLYLCSEYAWQACDGAFYMLPYFFNSESNISLILSSFPRFAMEKLRFFLSHSAPNPNSVYRKSAFNEYGDITDVLPQNVMVKGYDENMTISYDISLISNDYIDYLNNCSTSISQKGGILLFAYCPANKAAVTTSIVGDSGNDDYSRNDALDEYHIFLNDHLSLAIIGDPHGSAMDKEWFYDTNFHLNSYGKTLYTRQLIRNLKVYLSDSSITAIDIPEKPALLYTDNTTKKTLFSTTYAGNSNIIEVTIDNDIALIEDYAFKGCSSLKAIHIKSTVPSSIQIGQHLLDGTNAYIYVPADSLSLYKTDYKFSLYSDRIFEDEE